MKINKIILAIAVIASTVISSFGQQDLRYRSYSQIPDWTSTSITGSCPTHPGGNIPYRTNYGANGDYIVVGKLDNPGSSVLGSVQNFDDLAAKFMLLIDYDSYLTDPCVVKGDCGLLPVRPPYKDILEVIMDGVLINGQQIVVPDDLSQFDFRTKESLLNKQFELEANVQQLGPFRISMTVHNFILAYLAQNPGATEIVFEIGNEPNVHPYIPPELYADFYLKWHDAITATGLYYNAVNGTNIEFKVMNGGLWIHEGLPDALVDTDNPIFQGNHYLSTDVWGAIGRLYYEPLGTGVPSHPISPLISDTHVYIQRFLQELIRRGHQPKDKLDKLNLHFYPYVWKYFDSQNPHVAAGTWNFTPIDNANAEATLESIKTKMQLCLGNLAVLIDNYAPYTSDQEVWLTEFGNINPFDETIVSWLMNYAYTGLEVISDRGVAGDAAKKGLNRWYYFKVAGEDSKLERIPDIIEEMSNDHPSLAEIFGPTPTECLDPISLMNQPRVIVQCLLYDYAAQIPRQGLMNRPQTTLRRLGREYITRATGTECSNTADDKLVSIFDANGYYRTGYDKIEDALSNVVSNELISVAKSNYTIQSDAIVPLTTTNVTMNIQNGTTINLEGSIHLNPSGKIELGNNIKVLKDGNPFKMFLIDGYQSVGPENDLIGIFDDLNTIVQHGSTQQTISLGPGYFQFTPTLFVGTSFIGELGDTREQTTIISSHPEPNLPIIFGNQNNDGLLFKNIQWETNLSGGIFIQSSATAEGTGTFRMERCVFVNRNVFSKKSSTAAKLNLSGGNVEVVHCLFKNWEKGIEFFEPGATVTNNAVINGNIFDQVITAVHSQAGTTSRTFHSVQNNAFFDFTNALYEPGSTPIKDESVINAMSGNQNNYTSLADPGFVLPNYLDFRLAANSSLIDKIPPSTDIGPYEMGTVGTLAKFANAKLTFDNGNVVDVQNGQAVVNDMPGQVDVVSEIGGLVNYETKIFISKNLIANTPFTVEITRNDEVPYPDDLPDDFIVCSFSVNGVVFETITYSEMPPEGQYYSVVAVPDDVPPDAVQNVSINVSGNDVTLSWSANDEDDLKAYQIYRSQSSPVELISSNEVYSPGKEELAFQDGAVIDRGFAYAIIAVDSTGNKSEPIEVNSPLAIYVDDDGSDTTGDGSFDNPYQTVNHAYSKIPPVADNNYFILLHPGYYQECNTLSIIKRNQFSDGYGLTIKPVNAGFENMPILTSKGFGPVIRICDAGSNITFEGLQLLGNKKTINGITVDRTRNGKNSDITIRGCYFYSDRTKKIRVAGIRIHSTSGVVIENSVFHGIKGNAVTLSNVGKKDIMDNITIANNTIHNCVGFIKITHSKNGQIDEKTTVIANNIIDGISGFALFSVGSCDKDKSNKKHKCGSNFKVENCIFNDVRRLVGPNKKAFKFVDIIKDNPMFANATPSDFADRTTDLWTLAANSPAINAGTAIDVYPQDFYYNDRIFGEIIDIGAVEKGSVVQSLAKRAPVPDAADNSEPEIFLFDLATNFPNPFKENTQIRYTVPSSDTPIHTKLRVFNAKGNMVAVLVDEKKEAGTYVVSWDGRNNQGKTMQQGIYFYRLETGKNVKIKPMIKSM
ncbi:FlgD immunoglobulin-like domain containing protein [Fibrobacterota bacterium]